MKLKIIFFTILLPLFSFGQIYAPDGLRMPGDWNSFVNSLNMGGTFDLVKSSSGATTRWNTKFQYSGITGDQKFKFASGGAGNPWGNQWYFGDFGSEDASSLNVLQTYTWTNNGSVANNKVSVTNGRWYTVNWKDNGYTATQAIIMETENEPVTITGVVNNFSSRGSGNDGTVTITLNTSLSTGEKVFVRYTTDGWSTSAFVEASGTNTTYTATIPDAAIIGYNGNDEYYVLTTTVASPAHADADLITINLNNNGGSNYPLPVVLSSLIGSASRNMVILKWNTASEINNAGFEVQRKIAGEWKERAFMEGHGTTNAPQHYQFTDSNVPAGKQVYRLKQMDRDGKFSYSAEVEVFVGLTAGDYALSQNFPNPFNPSTSFTFAVQQQQHVQVKVFNLVGQEVATLVNGLVEPNVLQKVDFNASQLSSGVYFYALRTADRHEIRKFMLMK